MSDNDAGPYGRHSTDSCSSDLYCPCIQTISTIHHLKLQSIICNIIISEWSFKMLRRLNLTAAIYNDLTLFIILVDLVELWKWCVEDNTHPCTITVILPVSTSYFSVVHWFNRIVNPLILVSDTIITLFPLFHHNIILNH